LRRRRFDWILLVFFTVNLLLITYIIDIEQLTISDPYHFRYPLWPPKPFVDMVHDYGKHYDPLLMARPAFWRMTIWIDVIWNGPFYVAAVYALARGREWIRVPALVWCGTMSAVVLIILSEEYSGVHKSPHFAFVLAVNVPWLLLPLGTAIRVASQHPFTELVSWDDGAAAPSAGATVTSLAEPAESAKSAESGHGGEPGEGSAVTAIPDDGADRESP
jgi:emopamil binding protein